MAYTLPRMEKCCCISLRTGSLVIGYVSIVISALFTGAVSWSLYKVVMYVNSEVKPNPEHTAEEIAKVALGVYISHAYLLLVLLYYFFISLLLVIEQCKVHEILLQGRTLSFGTRVSSGGGYYYLLGTFGDNTFVKMEFDTFLLPYRRKKHVFTNGGTK
ncbi:PREDICTED: uncharacterized protein LOC106101508 isoform X3 [Papilio polytes]|uniref:uncharacterized protein LOC106101508 isoform X3 n=1 Tax=Papilio polytes TaxID=76194 RepID=UPI000676849A|nr:PREDICTED: uncharacterized protein LOC106101508 isoform X3 [Papilio polytes]